MANTQERYWLPLSQQNRFSIFIPFTSMKTIAIPALKTETSIGPVGSIDLLTKTCELWEQVREKDSSAPLFKVQIVSESQKPITYVNGVTIAPQATLMQSKPDIILVPALDGDIDASLRRNAAYVGWVRRAFARGVHVSSECTGAFILAAAGILDGRRATTHWFFADEFKRRFPKVRLCADQVIVDDGNIVTCGGATSFLNLVMYLVGKYFGRNVAVIASKMFLIDMDRPSQLPFHIFSARTDHTDTAIARSQKFVSEHFTQNIALQELARHTGMSPRNFSRRFKVATGASVGNYIQELRIGEAKRLLETTNLTASEIMYRIGYNDDRSFRRLFKRFTSLAPKQYRDKFRINFSGTEEPRGPSRLIHQHRPKGRSVIRPRRARS